MSRLEMRDGLKKELSLVAPSRWRSQLTLTEQEMARLNTARLKDTPALVVASNGGSVYHIHQRLFNTNGSFTVCSGYGWQERRSSKHPSSSGARKKHYTPCRKCFKGWSYLYNYLKGGGILSIAQNVWTGEVDTVEAPKEMNIKQTLEFQIPLDQLVQQIMEQLGFKQYKVTETSVNGGEVSVVATK